MKHVDDWIWGRHSPDEAERYAKFFLMLKRLPAAQQSEFAQYIEGYRLFCTYKDQRYRVTGASRLGDVWLAKDFRRSVGYDLRVDLADCSKWSQESYES